MSPVETTPLGRRIVAVLTAGVVALEVPYPLVHGQVRNALTIATVVVFAAASLGHAALAVSARAAVALLAVFGLGGFVAEVVGVHTGAPFGSYHYTGGLGPVVAGVPLTVGLAWVMMSWPSTCVANRLTQRLWMRVLIATIALAAWDVFLDPQMVDAHHWQWHGQPPHLPGIDDVPLSNFGGWIAVSAVLMVLLHVLVGRTRIDSSGLMIAIWIWTWLSSTLANVAFFHRPAVAAWGFVAMGLVGVPLLVSIRRQDSPR